MTDKLKEYKVQAGKWNSNKLSLNDSTEWFIVQAATDEDALKKGKKRSNNYVLKILNDNDKVIWDIGWTIIYVRPIINEIETRSILKDKMLEALGSRLDNIFGNDKAKWLDSPNIDLGGVTPFSLITTLEGIKQIDDLLSRIEDGAFS